MTPEPAMDDFTSWHWALACALGSGCGFGAIQAAGEAVSVWRQFMVARDALVTKARQG